MEEKTAKGIVKGISIVGMLSGCALIIMLISGKMFNNNMWGMGIFLSLFAIMIFLNSLWLYLKNKGRISMIIINIFLCVFWLFMSLTTYILAGFTSVPSQDLQFQKYTSITISICLGILYLLCIILLFNNDVKRAIENNTH